MNVELALKIGMLVFAISSISAIQILRKRVEYLEDKLSVYGYEIDIQQKQIEDLIKNKYKRNI